MTAVKQSSLTPEQVARHSLALLGRPAAWIDVSSRSGRHQVFECQSEAVVLKVFQGNRPELYGNELISLRALATEGILVPTILRHGSGSLGAPWILLQRLDGVVACDSLTEAGGRLKKGFVRQAAKWLVQVHQIPPSAFSGLRHNPLQARAERLDRAISRQVPTDRLHLARKAIGLAKELLPMSHEDRVVLVHRDFSARNIMHIPNMRRFHLTGVIDFEHSYLGDPTDDLATFLVSDLWNRRYLVKYFVDCVTAQRALPDFGDSLTAGVLINAAEILKWASDVDVGYCRMAERVCSGLIRNPRMLREILA